MTDAKKEWPWPRLYAEKIVREGGLEKAAQLLLDGEEELKPVYLMPEKEQSQYIGCKR